MRITNHKRFVDRANIPLVTGDWEAADWTERDQERIQRLHKRYAKDDVPTRRWCDKFLSALYEKYPKTWKRFYFFGQDKRMLDSVANHIECALLCKWCRLCSKQWVRSKHAATCDVCKAKYPDEAKRLFSEAMKTVRTNADAEAIRRKTIKTNRARYGVDAPAQNSAVRARMEATCLRNHGVRCPTQSAEVMAKQRKTNQKRYGAEVVLASKHGKTKMRKTHLKRRGVEFPSQDAKVREKIVSTLQKNYGVDNPMRDPKLASKCFSQSRLLHTVRIDGRQFTVQAKAELALVQRLVIKYGKHDVVTQFSKSFPMDEAHEACSYVPDFYVKSRDQFIECKSLWTLFKQHGQLKKNRRKAKYAGERLVWLVHLPHIGKSEFVELPTKWYKWSKSKLVSFMEDL